MAFDDRYVFVVGTGRCGSTLVQEVLARHPDTSFLTNVEDRVPRLHHVSGSWPVELYRRLPASATEKGRVRYAPSEGYRLLEREISVALSRSVRDLVASDATPWLSTRLRELIEGVARRRGLPVFTHKFTGWPRVGLLAAVFPGARFVHVVRDGRAVASSWLQMPWWEGYAGPDQWQWGPLAADEADAWEQSGRSYPVLAALLWRRLIDAFDAARGALPTEQWLELRYEDIVREPGECFARVREFAGLPASDAFDAAVARHPFSGARQDAYARDLGADAVAAMEACLADHLARRGYTR